MPISFLKVLISKPIIILLVLILGIAISVYLAQQRQSLENFASNKGVVLVMVPNFLVVEKGKSYDIQVGVNTGDETITAVEMHLKYDTKKIKVTDIIGGDFLPLMVGMSINPDLGTAQATFIINPDHPQKGFGNLAKIKITNFSDQSSEVKFSEETKVTSIGRNTNALETTVGTRLSTQKPSDSKKGLGDKPVPQGLVHIDPTAYVRDFWETPLPTTGPITDENKSWIYLDQIKQIIFKPFELIGNLNKNLQEKTKQALDE